MAQQDPRIDAYIAGSAAFAQPILRHLREVVHAACPEIEETIKWGSPSFTYAGRILCAMAAFKQHASFGFWQRTAALESSGGRGGDGKPEGMGQFGKLTRIGDLPDRRVLAACVKQAMDLIDAGVARPATRSASPKPPLEVPDDLTAALAKNRAARVTFDAFTPSQRREYVEWITQAKRDDTRQRRLQQAVEWMAQGKPRNWKYVSC